MEQNQLTYWCLCW